MKTILITGGAGFIGSNLCRRLVKDTNNYVICLDNFFTGRMENIQALKSLDNFEVMRHDITQPIMVQVDEIYHLACPASPIHYQFDPIKTIETNVQGTIVALKMAVETKAKILLTSTSEVYGDPLEHPQRETYLGNVNCCGPRACYDEGKRVAEALMCSYQQQHHVDIRIARIFNTYGPMMNPLDGRVVSNVINQMLRNEPITIYGDGTQTRSFCYVDDMVEGLIALMNADIAVTMVQPNPHPHPLQQPVNLGNPCEVTMLELVDAVKSIVKTNSQIVFSSLPQDDPMKRKPCIDKAKHFLQWEPRVKLMDGLQKTVQYYSNLS